MRPYRRGFLSFIIVVFLGGLFLSLPPVSSRVMNALENARVRVRAMIFPQNEVVFLPGGEVLPTITPQAETPQPTLTPAPTSSPVVAALSTPRPTPTATLAPTPLPAAFSLQGVRWETQNGAWNYCGPTNLAMLLSYWGWKGDKFAPGKYLKPFDYDLNVMPYEMQNYVQEKTTGLGLEVRSGASLALIKQLIANGFPVLIETGVYFPETATGVDGWMGHYRVLTGYNDDRKEVIAQDSYLKADLAISYDALVQNWRAFNFVIGVAYSMDKHDALVALLGSGYVDPAASYTTALKTASDETLKLSGTDQYFAWYNRGSSLVALQDYVGAAQAYDRAFELYAKLPEDRRPWRMIWHQTGPYFAYFFAGRYQDVADLATNTLDFVTKRADRLGIADRPQVGPFIEETWVWRARARLVLGNQKGAIEDLRTALKYHPGFQAAVDELKRLGINP